MRKKFLLFLFVILFGCGAVYAQEEVQVSVKKEPAQAKQRFDIGAGYWYTQGSLDMNLFVDANDSLAGLFYNVGDKVSELNYDTDAGLYVINAEAWIWWKFYAGGFVGWGDVEGSTDDSDWFSLISADRWSLSKSDANGDVTTWDINGYLRIIEEPEDKGFLDVSMGYFYYRDDIKHIKNGTQLIENWTAVNYPLPSSLDSSDRYTFDGLRLGVRGKIRLHKRVAVKAGVGICPWLNVKEAWDWNLAGHTGTGEADGTAIDFNAGLEIDITKNLSIEAGYKYINLDSDNGDLKWKYTSGYVATTKDNWNVEATRSGFYAMGRLKI